MQCQKKKLAKQEKKNKFFVHDALRLQLTFTAHSKKHKEK